MNETLVLIEDDQVMRDFLVDLFQENNFVVTSFERGTSAIKRISQVRPDIVILDRGLPDVTGETVLQETKELYPDLPVIMLTAKSTSSDITDGFNLGADDYVSKPFDAQVLLSRVKARLRKTTVDKNKIEVGELVIDLDTHEVTYKETSVDLTKTEFKLLCFLAKHAGKVMNRDLILNHVWGFNTDVETRVVDVFVGYLRKKLDPDGKHELIKSKRGFGYYLKS